MDDQKIKILPCFNNSISSSSSSDSSFLWNHFLKISVATHIFLPLHLILGLARQSSRWRRWRWQVGTLGSGVAWWRSLHGQATENRYLIPRIQVNVSSLRAWSRKVRICERKSKSQLWNLRQMVDHLIILDIGSYDRNQWHFKIAKLVSLD